MLHLAVFMERINQPVKLLRLAVDKLKIAVYLFRRHLAVPYRLGISGNYGNRRFKVVGDIGDKPLSFVIHPLSFRFTFGKHVRHSVHVAAYHADFPRSLHFLQSHIASAGKPIYCVIQRNKRFFDFPVHPEEERSYGYQIKRNEQQIYLVSL